MKFKVELHGRGGEVVIGAVSPEAYTFFVENEIDIEDYATNPDFLDENEEIDLPDSLMPFEPGEWSDCDDVVHASGVYVDDMIVIVKNDDHEIIFEPIDIESLKSMGGKIEIIEDTRLENQKGSHFFFGMTIEKGHFFSFEIEDQEFDLKKISIMCSKFPGGIIVEEIMYNGGDAVDLDERETYTQMEDFELREFAR